MAPSSGAFLRPNAGKLASIHRLLDCALVALSLLAACWLYDVEPDAKYMFAALLAAVAFAFAAELTHLYGSWRMHALRAEAMELLLVIAVVAAILVGAAFFTKTSAEYSRVVLLNWGLLAFSTLALERIAIRAVLRTLRKSGRNTRSLAIAGIGKTAQNVARQVESADWAGMTTIGHFDDLGQNRDEDGKASIDCAGTLLDLVLLARRGEVDYIYIALPTKDDERILWLVNELADTTASVFVVPDLFIFQLSQARWTDFGGLPIVSIYESPFEGLNGTFKRIEDVVLASLILIIVAIPMLLIAAIIKLTSKGTVIFKQRRYGLNGKVVEVWKFRSMTVSDDGDTVTQAQKHDPRVTPFGAFLRRTSLDELPQFINVLMGDMSVVGPRPHAVAHNEQYRGLIPGYMLRHKVKPGITGWAQVRGWRGETDTLDKMQRRVECDLEYMRNWSIWFDLKIVALTIIRGFFGKNAY
jgi:putative colanic acid biosynthesis UDP-glucose lipid carrier transferase